MEFLPVESSLHQARERPICVSLVICNEVIEDKRSGNLTLVGLFNSVLAPRLPVVHPRMFVMASLTSGTGSWDFAFRITSPGGREVMRMAQVVQLNDPLIVHDLVVELRNLPIEEAGVYFVDLLLADAQVANRRFTVQLGDNTPQSDINVSMSASKSRFHGDPWY